MHRTTFISFWFVIWDGESVAVGSKKVGGDWDSADSKVGWESMYYESEWVAFVKYKRIAPHNHNTRSYWYLTTSISFWFVRCGKSVGSRVGCDCESVRSNKLSKYKYKLIHQYLTTSISLWSVSMHHLTLFLNEDNALRWRGRADLIAGILFVDCCWYCTLESLPQPQSLWPLQQLEVLHCKDSDTSWKDSK